MHFFDRLELPRLLLAGIDDDLLAVEKRPILSFNPRRFLLLELLVFFDLDVLAFSHHVSLLPVDHDDLLLELRLSLLIDSSPAPDRLRILAIPHLNLRFSHFDRIQPLLALNVLVVLIQ